MGSQPSSLSTHRELQGFIVTKRLSARQKLNSSLSKKFSDSDILTLIQYNDKDFSYNQTLKNLKRPRSEQIISLSEVTESENIDTKTCKFVPYLSSLTTQQVQTQQLEDSKCIESNKKDEKHMDKIAKTKSVEHLDHWVHKNEPYIQTTDIHTELFKKSKEEPSLSTTKSVFTLDASNFVVPQDKKSYDKTNTADKTMFSVTEQDKNKDQGDEAEKGDKEDIPLSEEEFEKKKVKKMSKIKTAMQGIKNGQEERTPEGYMTDEFRAHVLAVNSSYFAFKSCPLKMRIEYRTEVAGAGVHPENNTINIFCNLVYSILQKGYRNSEGKSVDALFKPLRNMIGHLQNMSDFHAPTTKIILGHTDLLKKWVQMIVDYSGPHLKKELKENDTILLGGILGIIHNLGQIEENVHQLRKFGIIDAVRPYLNSDSDLKRLCSLAILADVVNEEESGILNDNEDVIKFVVKSLKKSMQDKFRRCHGWSVREITRTIRMVARNDNNKRTVVTHGAIPLLVDLAEKAESVEEQREAVGALWTLSFDEQTRSEMINKNNDCLVIDTFYKLHKADDAEVRRICGKALWTLREPLKSSEHYKHIGEKFSTLSTPEQAVSETHVMLSYNWGNQALVKQIRDNLRNNGIKVWMDVDDMQGSTLQAMASAVEKADIVLVCYSQKYKNSDNCRAEAEYAFQLKKKIIPVKMEKGYNADGWLGFIIGAKLFFDFSGKYPFENKIRELIKEVQVSLNKIKGIAWEVAEPVVKVQISPMVVSQPLQATSAPKPSQDIDKVKKWTPQHVGKWLDKNSLPRNLLGRLSGIEVAFLHVLVKESPDIYYKTIGEQLGVKDILTMAKLRFALEVLDVNI